MSQESHYWNAFLIRFTKTHFLHPPNYDYWDVSYIVGKVWMRRLQRRWNRRKRFSNDGVIPRINPPLKIHLDKLFLGITPSLLNRFLRFQRRCNLPIQTFPPMNDT